MEWIDWTDRWAAIIAVVVGYLRQLDYSHPSGSDSAAYRHGNLQRSHDTECNRVRAVELVQSLRSHPQFHRAGYGNSPDFRGHHRFFRIGQRQFQYECPIARFDLHRDNAFQCIDRHGNMATTYRYGHVHGWFNSERH